MKFLLVDDNKLNLDLQKIMLESYDLKVDTAESGEQAVELAHENNYFMIFMDIHMPGIDGFEASAKIRQFDISVPIIALSADDISPTDERFVISRMNGAIKKPLDLKELKELLSQYMDLSHLDKGVWRRKTDIVLDKEELLDFFPDDKSVTQTLQQFLNIHIYDCDKLRVHINNKDFNAAHSIIHDIVGISGNLCCNRLYEAARRLDNDLKRKSSDSFSVFSDVWKKTVGEISEFCSKMAARNVPTNTEKCDWQTLWKDFCDLCGDFDVVSAQIFHDNSSAFAAHLKANDFEQLKNAINRYDFIWIIDNLGGFDVSGIIG